MSTNQAPLKIIFLIITSCTVLNGQLNCQSSFFKSSADYNRERVRGIVITEAITGTIITTGLNYLWYKKFPHSRFHFFNDNNEWLGMDKIGHATTSYNISAIQGDLLRWAGVKQGSAAVIGSLTALAFMTMIEVMDGHSDKWGFSKGDMLANMAGCLLFEGQQLLWGQQRLSLKFSYKASIFPRYNPDELGRNLLQRILKDYNGQTYWLSANISSFFPASAKFPLWLNLSAGYGAEGMIGASANPAAINGNPVPTFDRYRQFYFSFDTDLYRINNTSPFVNSLLKLNRTFKMPSPTIEWNKIKKTQFHWIYF